MFLTVGLIKRELAFLAVPLRFTQKLEFVGIDECHVLRAAGLFVIPGLGPLPAFEKDPAAFVQMFGNDLGTFAEGLDVEPLGVFLRLSALFFQRSVLAMVKVAMAVPPGVYFISGSLPRYPISRVFCMGLSPVNLKLRSSAKR